MNNETLELVLKALKEVTKGYEVLGQQLADTVELLQEENNKQ